MAGFAPPKLKRLDPLVEGAVAPDAAGAELPEPIPENKDAAGVVVVEGMLLVVVVVAPPEAVVLGAAEAAGLPRLNKELPAAVALELFAPENRLLFEAVDDAGGAVCPPRLKEAIGAEDGWVEGGAAGVFPRPKVGGLLAGVAEGVELP
jgi:hypothetical protein